MIIQLPRVYKLPVKVQCLLSPKKQSHINPPTIINKPLTGKPRNSFINTFHLRNGKEQTRQHTHLFTYFVRTMRARGFPDDFLILPASVPWLSSLPNKATVEYVHKTTPPSSPHYHPLPHPWIKNEETARNMQKSTTPSSRNLFLLCFSSFARFDRIFRRRKNFELSFSSTHPAPTQSGRMSFLVEESLSLHACFSFFLIRPTSIALLRLLWKHEHVVRKTVISHRAPPLVSVTKFTVILQLCFEQQFDSFSGISSVNLPTIFALGWSAGSEGDKQRVGRYLDWWWGAVLTVPWMWK